MEALSARAPAPPRLGRPPRALPDAKLVARVRAGDELAFEAVFDRYHRQLLAFCRHMLGTREEAEDALQHVFVSAHSHLVAESDRVIELRPWLYAIARNRCLSVLRARREAVALDDLPEPGGDGLAVAHEVEKRQDLQELLEDLRRLPDEQREALVLSELGALSHDEIAEVIGVRREKVKALVFQARESLAGWRTARTTDCREIREQLATLHGGALRRGPLRKHLDTCDGCRAFRGEVRRQREAMALLLPVVPSVALKAKVLGAVAAGSSFAPAAGAGIGAGVAGSAGTGLAGTAAGAGGSAAAVGGGLVAKALMVAALAGTAGGGYAIVKDQTSKPAVRSAPAVLPGGGEAGLLPETAAATPAAGTPRGGSENGARGDGKATAKTDPGRSQAAREGERGRPAVRGAQGLENAPKSRGLEHRRDYPPAHGRGGTDKTLPGGSNGSSRRDSADSSKPARPVRPSRPAGPARPAPGSRQSGADSQPQPQPVAPVPDGAVSDTEADALSEPLPTAPTS